MWATSRRLIIVAILASIALAVVAAVLIATLYEAPSCVDGKMNQTEEGIDCGGTCPYLCTANVAEPSVQFVRALPNQGRTDVVAYIQNRNPFAAVKDAQFTVEVYDANRALIGSADGSVDLPPGASVPVFIPNVVTGTAPVAQTFLEFDSVSMRWYSSETEQILPRVEDIEMGVVGNSPRITARLENPTVQGMRNIPVVVAVFDASNKIIAASRTVVGSLSGQGSASVVFTWSTPFEAEAARIDVRPVLELP